MLRPVLVLDDKEREYAKKILSENFDSPVVVFHPYATHPNKAWIEDYWQTLAKKLQQSDIDYIVIGKSDSGIVGLDPAKDFTNRTDLRQTSAIIAGCAAMVTGDSGPMHLATAVNTPVAALFGPTAKAWGFFPSGERDTVFETHMDCRPCSLHGKKPCDLSRHCLEMITPDMVAKHLAQTIITRNK